VRLHFTVYGKSAHSGSDEDTPTVTKVAKKTEKQTSKNKEKVDKNAASQKAFHMRYIY
jgi:hypothetical protein